MKSIINCIGLTLLTILGLGTFGISAQGQEYLVTYKGDTVFGTIERVDFSPKTGIFINSRSVNKIGYEDQVRFIDENGKESIYVCGEIMGFNGAGRFFESFYIHDINKEGNNMVFSEKIVSGKANLYKVVQSVIKSGPTRQPEKTVQEYRYLAVAGKPTVRMSSSKKKLRELLIEYLSDDEITLAAINEKGFKNSIVREILRDYNLRNLSKSP
jgi:hypothetical protein